MIGIAICGPAGCGKTTVAKYLVENHGFKRLSFAGGLKKVAVDFFGMIGKDRTLLQLLGEKMREIDPKVWINYTVDNFDGFNFIVIDDMRYPNEYEALKKMGFVILKLVGRSHTMTKEQMEHESEQYWKTFNEDFTIDTSRDLSDALDDIETMVAKIFLREMEMDMQYFEKVAEANKGNKNYVRGRNFEYRTMRVLRNQGFHCMRKFKSADDNWRQPDGSIRKVSLDVTAYKNGVYLLISCKYSIKGPTSWLVDSKWKNLRDYADQFGETCVPVFAGVDEGRHVYFVNLRTLKIMDMEALFNNIKHEEKPPAERSMQELLEWAWELLDIIKEQYYGSAEGTLKQKWAAELIKHTNVLQRIIYRSGDTGTKEDLTKMIEDAVTFLEEEEKKDESRQN